MGITSNFGADLHTQYSTFFVKKQGNAEIATQL